MKKRHGTEHGAVGIHVVAINFSQNGIHAAEGVESTSDVTVCGQYTFGSACASRCVHEGGGLLRQKHLNDVRGEPE